MHVCNSLVLLASTELRCQRKCFGCNYCNCTPKIVLAPYRNWNIEREKLASFYFKIDRIVSTMLEDFSVERCWCVCPCEKIQYTTMCPNLAYCIHLLYLSFILVSAKAWVLFHGYLEDFFASLHNKSTKYKEMRLSWWPWNDRYILCGSRSLSVFCLGYSTHARVFQFRISHIHISLTNLTHNLSLSLSLSVILSLQIQLCF